MKEEMKSGNGANRPANRSNHQNEENNISES
jgi:hypothetical protein